MDLSACFLHTLGDREGSLLEELRGKLRDDVPEASSEGTLWGVDLSIRSDASDIILLKYLRAEELDVEKTRVRVASTLVFRSECKIDEVVASGELPQCCRGHDLLTGCDRAGRPVCISRFGEMDVDRVFGDAEVFVRYRLVVLEKTIARLQFDRGTPETLCQIHDYSGVLSSTFKPCVKKSVSTLSKILEAHYPEFKGQTLFVNFPAIFSGPFKLAASLLPLRTRQKFRILGHHDFEALFEHVGPEAVPEFMGGVWLETGGALADLPAHFVRVPAWRTQDVVALKTEGSTRIEWELRVCMADISYEVSFSSGPEGGGGDTQEASVLVQRSEPGEPLLAEAGIARGEYQTPQAGILRIRLHSDRAWFSSRVCVYRAGPVDNKE